MYKPVGYIPVSKGFTHYGPILYTVILSFSGLVVMFLSRMILYRVQRRHQLELKVYVIWLAAEIGIFTLVITTIAHFINGNDALSYPHILWRVALDIVAILFIPYIISILIYLIKEKNLEIEALQAMLNSQSGVPLLIDDSINFYDKGGRLAFATKRSNVLYVEASDNYTNIHYINGDKPDCFILHTSMKQIEEAYAQQGMMRCHRSYLVNLSNVKLLRRDKENLVLELANCDKPIPVSKSYVDRVAHCFTVNS
ncbi:MAG: LytTR family transcriptional regulator [Bacteroidales bacterium]|nr:LytTR family transcriptional regulator [Bacteroidales bacterium]